MPNRTSGSEGPSNWYRVGDAVVEPDRLRVRVDGIERRLEPRVMRLLNYLATKPQRIFKTHELLKDVWDNKVDDNAISSAVRKLRRALGDSVRNPRYIESASGEGYRLIADVSGPGAPSPVLEAKPGVWTRNPYVGLDAFNATQEDIFCGRHQTTCDLIEVLRRQLENQRRFVLVLGPSGSGKTSLLQAGVVPELCRSSGVNHPHALSVARCDLSACRDGAAQMCLIEALATWTLGSRQVFGPESPGERAARLLAREEAITATIGDAFKKHLSRELSEQPLAHLLLVVDHAETLVSSRAVSDDERRGFAQLLMRLCATPRVAVLMVARSDDYAKLMAIPEISALDGGDGSFYVGPPKPEDIADIIQKPAAQAGVTFERDARSGHTLDEVLRNATAGRPDALPLLQYTLEALYEKCVERDTRHVQGQDRGESDGRSSEGGKRRELRFADYREMGELAGSIGKRAEKVYESLPNEMRKNMDAVFAALIAFPVDSDVPYCRMAPHAALRSPHARDLADAFVNARLFVSHDREIDHAPVFALAHDAVLRNWKRAVDWSTQNKPLKQAGERLRVDAERWKKSGRRADHLLNPGEPLLVATAAADRFPDDVDAVQREYLHASQRLAHRSRRLRHGAIIALCVFSLVSTALALFAFSSLDRAEQERRKAQALTSYMLVDLAEELRPSGNIELLDEISKRVLAQIEKRPINDMDRDDLIGYSQALRTRGEVNMARGQDEEAENLFRQASESANRAWNMDRKSNEALYELGQVAFWNGSQKRNKKRYDDAEKEWKHYLDISEELYRRDPHEPMWMMERGYALTNLGVLASDVDRPQEASTRFKAAAIWQEKASSLPAGRKKLDWPYQVIVTQSWIARSEYEAGKIESSAKNYGRQIAALATLIDEHPKFIDWEHQQSGFLNMAAEIDLLRGQLEEGERRIEDGIAILSRITRLEPEDLGWKRDLAKAHLVASDIARARGRLDAAADHVEEAAAAAAKLGDPNNLRADTQRMILVIKLRRAQLGLGVMQEAESAIVDLHELSAKFPHESVIAVALAEGLLWRGRRAAANGRADAARADWRDANRALSRHLQDSHNVKLIMAHVATKKLLGEGQSVVSEWAWLRSVGVHDSAYILR